MPYLNHFNESKRMFRWTLRKLFLFFYFFLQHSKVNLQTSTYIFYISMALDKYAVKNLRSSVLFYKNLHSAARKFAHSAVCGNTSGSWKEIENGQPKSLVAEKYGVPRNTISTWLEPAYKEKIMGAFSSGTINLKIKSIKTGKYEELDKAFS